MTQNTLVLHDVVQFRSYKENTASSITILCTGVGVIETEQQNCNCHSERLRNYRDGGDLIPNVAVALEGKE